MKGFKCYFWKADKDDELGYAIIAHNIKQAKRIGWAHNGSEAGNDNDWIEQVCHLQKDVNCDGITVSCVLDSKEGLRRGGYSFIDGEKCEICKTEERLYLVNGKCVCSDCEDKVEELDSKESSKGAV